MSPRSNGVALVLADRLHSASIHLLRRLRRVDDATGVSAPSLSALSVLAFGGPRTLGELAAAERVRPPTMTRVVQDLERRGLVRRGSDSDDRRKTRLEATPAGARLLRAGQSRRVAALATRVSQLGSADRRALDRALTAVRGILDGWIE